RWDARATRKPPRPVRPWRRSERASAGFGLARPEMDWTWRRSLRLEVAWAMARPWTCSPRPPRERRAARRSRAAQSVDSWRSRVEEILARKVVVDGVDEQAEGGRCDARVE